MFILLSILLFTWIFYVSYYGHRCWSWCMLVLEYNYFYGQRAVRLAHYLSSKWYLLGKDVHREMLCNGKILTLN